MATTNIQELLTRGLFTQPSQEPAVDPRARLSGMDLLASEGLKAGEASARLFSEGGNVLRKELIGLTPEEQLAEELQQLNLETPEGLTRLAEIQRMTGDLEGSLQTLGAIQGMAQQQVLLAEEQALREGLLKIARSRGDETAITFIESGGDLKTISDRLLKEKTEQSRTYSLSKGDTAEYDLYFEDYDEDFLKSVGYDTPLFGKIDKTDKKKLYAKAEQIFTNNPRLGREGALDEALRLKAGGGIIDNSTTTGATPRGKQKDPYSSVTE